MLLVLINQTCFRFQAIPQHLAHKCTWSAGQNTQHPQSKSSVMAPFWLVSGNGLGHSENPFTAECMLTSEHEDFSLSFILTLSSIIVFFPPKMLYFFSAPECCAASSNPVMHPRHVMYQSSVQYIIRVPLHVNQEVTCPMSPLSGAFEILCLCLVYAFV